MMIMTHGDDKGLVLPPKVAGLQVVIVPILFKVHALLSSQLIPGAHLHRSFSPFKYRLAGRKF